MDERKELLGLAGNEFLLAVVNSWQENEQDVFFELIRLLNSSGIDMWYVKHKKNIIRCGIRLLGKNRDRAYLKFGEVTC